MTTTTNQDKTPRDEEWYTAMCAPPPRSGEAMSTLEDLLEEARMLAPRERAEVVRDLRSGKLHQRWVPDAECAVPLHRTPPQWFLRDLPLMRGDYAYVARVKEEGAARNWRDAGEMHARQQQEEEGARNWRDAGAMHAGQQQQQEAPGFGIAVAVCIMVALCVARG